jgi:endoglucanase
VQSLHSRHLRKMLIAFTLAAVLIATLAIGLLRATGQSQPPGDEGLRVQGNRIVNAHGAPVLLTGFNNSGAEYACVEGWGIFDAPGGKMTPAIVAAMATWAGANVVRIPVDEQCWLGLPGVKPAYSGATYRRAIERYVSLLNAHGFAAILDLAGAAPGNETVADHDEMPDSHSVAFWRSAATAFRDNPEVLFDLFNEPWPLGDTDSPAAWSCWLNGGCAETSQNGADHYRAVGMQQLVNTIRGTGARNIIIAEGIQYGATLDGWLQYRPRDPAGNLVASVHVYSFNACPNLHCYNGALRRVAARVPLLIGELGPDLAVPYQTLIRSSCPMSDVGHTGFDSTVLRWARQNEVSWIAWSWNPWNDCWALVRNFHGVPTTPYGDLIKSALASQGR